MIFPRLRDQKNREMFEKYFPELKIKREHQERMTRYWWTRYWGLWLGIGTGVGGEPAFRLITTFLTFFLYSIGIEFLHMFAVTCDWVDHVTLPLAF